MLLERDLTILPFENTFNLLGINILLGVLSFFAAQNILAGLILNFIAIFIMIMQFIVNKNKLEKSSEKILINTCDELLVKVEKLESSVGLSLERISSILDSYIKENEASTNLLYKDNYNKDKLLSVIKSEIKNLKLYINKYEEIKNKVETENIEDIYLYEFYNEYKKHSIYENKKTYKNNSEAPGKFKTMSVYKRNFDKDSLRFSYALKVGLATSIAGFIMDYFKLTEVNMYAKIKNNSYKIKKILLIPVLIEEKLLQINEMYKDHNQEHFIKKQKHLTNNLYSLYINIKENKIKDNNVEKILKDIDYIFKDENHQKSRDRILEEIYYSEDLKNKIVYKNLLHSLNVLNKKMKKYLHKIKNLKHLL